MNKKQYNNVIDWTLTHDQSAQTEDSLKTARTVFKNMGVALPQGDLKQVSDVLKTDDYMGWRSCTMSEAQAAADRGTAAIGINEEKIIILAANDEEQPVTATASVMTLSDTAAVSTASDLAFYSYSYGTTPSNPGGGGTTTCPISFCGGSNYSDVTQHNMALCGDGYYVCTQCGYRVKSPALQDRDVLNDSDYLTIVSLLHEYLSIVRLYPIYAEKMLAMIDAIRGLPENKMKYEYCDENGIYVSEYNIRFGNTQMYVHVDKGSCVTKWVLLKTLYSITSTLAPFPYSIMISAISDLVAQQHPGTTEMTGADIVKTWAGYLADGLINIPGISSGSRKIFEIVKNAADIYLTYDDIIGGISCTSECYNINIVTISKEELYDCHQIEYHFSNGVGTMGRHSEYNVNGINNVYVGADYYDHVNDREYDVYIRQPNI